MFHYKPQQVLQKALEKSKCAPLKTVGREPRKSFTKYKHEIFQTKEESSLLRLGDKQEQIALCPGSDKFSEPNVIFGKASRDKYKATTRHLGQKIRKKPTLPSPLVVSQYLPKHCGLPVSRFACQSKSQRTKLQPHRTGCQEWPLPVIPRLD